MNINTIHAGVIVHQECGAVSDGCGKCLSYRQVTESHATQNFFLVVGT